MFYISFEIVHEWNGLLEIFSCPQITENSTVGTFLRTDIFCRKSSLGASALRQYDTYGIAFKLFFICLRSFTTPML